MLSAEEGGLAVDSELCAARLEVNDAENPLYGMPVSKLCNEPVGVRAELAPQFQSFILVFYGHAVVRAVGLLYGLPSHNIAEFIAHRGENQLQFVISLNLSVHTHRHRETLLCRRGLDSHVLDVKLWQRLKVNHAENAVPVGLCVLGTSVTVGENLLWHGVLRVVHLYRKHMLARC